MSQEPTGASSISPFVTRIRYIDSPRVTISRTTLASMDRVTALVAAADCGEILAIENARAYCDAAASAEAEPCAVSCSSPVAAATRARITTSV